MRSRSPALSGGADTNTLVGNIEGMDKLSEFDAEPALIDTSVYLDGGQSFRTLLPAESDIVRKLHQALITGAATSKLIQVPIEGGRRAFSFNSARIVAVETCPPIVVDESFAVDHQDELAQPEEHLVHDAALDVDGEVPEVRRRRTPPVVYEAPGMAHVDYDPVPALAPQPYVLVTDFLTPDERSLLLETTLAAESHFLTSNGCMTRTLWQGFDPALAERLIERLRLLIPQLIPSFDLARTIEPDDLQAWAHYNDDIPNGELAPTASSNEISCQYFFQRRDDAPTGGELQFQNSDQDERIQPRNNELIIYRSDALSGMSALHCSGDRFEDCRFSVTIRIP